MYAHSQAAGRFPNQPQHNAYGGYPPNQGMPPPQYLPQQGYPQPLGQHSQLYGDSSQNPQRGSIRGTTNQMQTKKAGLMQPPALNVEQPLDTNSQFLHQRGPMTMSNNQHSEFDTYHQQDEEGMWTHEAQIASMFWQQRCMTMLQRFEWFYERFQILRNDHLGLSEQMQKMDSEDQWHIFQQHHEQFQEKIEQMQQELAAVLGQNQQLLQQKRTQDSESVWEQRYQELLSNFKSLQEEMMHLESSGGRGGVPPEQYRQLQEHCAQLEYQYEQAYNQLKMHRQGMSADVQNQIHAYMQQNQSYKQRLNTLHAQNVQLQKMLEQYQGQNDQLKQQRYKFNIDRNKFEDLIRQVEQKEHQIHSLQEEFKVKNVPQVNIMQYEHALSEKNKEIDDLRRAINEKNSEIDLSKSRLQQLENNARLKLREELQLQKKSQQKRNSEYQQQITELKRQIQRSSQSNSRIQNLQKKLTYSNQQISNLNDTLKKKNQQLIELRGLSYEVQKLKEVQNDLLNAADERDRLSNLLRKKGQDLQKAHKEIEKLNLNLNQLSSKKQEYSTRNLRSQIDDLTSQIRKNEGQINKLKSIINMKDQYAAKLESDLHQTCEKLAMVEQVLSSQRQTWHQRQLRFSAKNNDYSQRIRALDYEFNIQMKQTLQKQISALRKQNADRLQTIRSFEQKQLLLTSQLSVYQKQQSNHSSQISLQKQKHRQLINSLEIQAKRYKQLQQIIKNKDESIANNQKRIKQILQQSTKLNIQIQQDQKLLKVKQKTIKSLQQQLNTSVMRQGDTDKLRIQISHLKMTIQNLQRQKYKQQSPLSKSKGLSAVNSRKNIESQQNVISQLWKQNQLLKQQVSKLVSKTYELPIQLSKDKQSSTIDLNRRLNQFNNKLQLTIGNNISNPTAQFIRSQSQKSLLQWQKQKISLINHYQNIIDQLKYKKIEDGRLQNSQASGLSHGKKNLLNGIQSDRLHEEVAFLRQKSQQTQQRNKQLIRINQDLKTKIDSLLKVKNSITTLEYYKNQLNKSQIEKQNLKQKLKKIGEENRQYKLDLATKNSKLIQEYQFKLTQYQILIQEQQRKITLLHGDKAAANNSRASYEHQNAVRGLAKSPNARQEQSGVLRSSQAYKQGIQDELGSIMGNYTSYNKYQPLSKSNYQNLRGSQRNQDRF